MKALKVNEKFEEQTDPIKDMGIGDVKGYLDHFADELYSKYGVFLKWIPWDSNMNSTGSKIWKTNVYGNEFFKQVNYSTKLLDFNEATYKFHFWTSLSEYKELDTAEETIQYIVNFIYLDNLSFGISTLENILKNIKNIDKL